MGQTAGYVAIMIAVGSIFFEVSKIKINPISFLLKWIGKRMFEPMNSRLDAVEKKIDENEIDRIRWEILEFANTCRNGKRHTKDEFSHIIAQNDKYHIVPDIRCQFRHHRNIADRCAEGELLILDPQSVLPDFLCPVSPGKQGHILSGVKQIPCQIAP